MALYLTAKHSLFVSTFASFFSIWVKLLHRRNVQTSALSVDLFPLRKRPQMLREGFFLQTRIRPQIKTHTVAVSHVLKKCGIPLLLIFMVHTAVGRGLLGY